ncbi:MAG TPA: hypothetical protein VGU00_01790 [Sphingopyxis sp.]|nr:hypothetical protein [Sphingopyxis sp.]
MSARIEFQRTADPHLIADVRMYETDAGGRKGPALPGWVCPVMISKDQPLEGWDAFLLLRDQPISPGECRRIGIHFVFGEAGATAAREAGKFYLWEGGFVGEGIVVA